MLSVKDFAQGVGAGVLESVFYGVLRDLEVYYDMNNETIYLIGIVDGNTAMGIISKVGTVSGGTVTVVASPSGVGGLFLEQNGILRFNYSFISSKCISQYNVNCEPCSRWRSVKSAGIKPKKGEEYRGGGQKIM